MHPVLQALLMAARGHTGLPPTIQHAQPQQTAAPATTASGGSDQQVATGAAQQLHSAIAAAKDTELKAALSTALAALHKYLVSDEKQVHQAMAGKMSPKVMARAAGR